MKYYDYIRALPVKDLALILTTAHEFVSYENDFDPDDMTPHTETCYRAIDGTNFEDPDEAIQHTLDWLNMDLLPESEKQLKQFLTEKKPEKTPGFEYKLEVSAVPDKHVSDADLDEYRNMLDDLIIFCSTPQDAVYRVYTFAEEHPDLEIHYDFTPGENRRDCWSWSDGKCTAHVLC